MNIKNIPEMTEYNKDRICSVNFQVNAGFFSKRKFRRILIRRKFNEDTNVDFDWIEEKNWLDSVFMIKLYGLYSNVYKECQWWNELIEKYN